MWAHIQNLTLPLEVWVKEYAVLQAVDVLMSQLPTLHDVSNEIKVSLGKIWAHNLL